MNSTRVTVNSELSFRVDKDVWREIRDAFIHSNPRYYRNRHTEPRRIKSFSAKSCGDKFKVKLPRGQLHELRAELRELDITVELIDNRLTVDPHEIDREFELWSYQDKAATQMCRFEQALLISPTGSGKTRIGLAIFADLKQPACILVPGTDLIDEWIDRTEKLFGFTPIALGGKRKKPTDDELAAAPLIISTPQSAKSRMDILAATRGMVLADESQRWAAKTFKATLERFPAKYRFSVSADETRKDRMHFLIYDAVGKPRIRISPSVVEEYKMLTEVMYMVPIEFDHEKSFDKASQKYNFDWPSFTEEWASDTARNQFMAEFIVARLKESPDAVAMVYSIRHEQIQTVKKIIEAYGFEVGTLTGKEKKTARRELIHRMNERAVRVSLCTQVGDAGINIPNLSMTFHMMRGVTNRQRFNQKLGRAERGKRGGADDTKPQPVAFYFWDYRPFWYDLDAARRVVRTRVWGDEPKTPAWVRRRTNWRK